MVFRGAKECSMTETANIQIDKNGHAFRFMLYNIRYGAGIGRRFHLPLPYCGYLKQTNGNFDKIAEFIELVGPDVIGLIEVDTGSFRTQNSNQAETIARAMQYDYVYHVTSAENSYRKQARKRHINESEDQISKISLSPCWF